MSDKTITGDDGKTYEVRSAGTIHEVPNNSGEILGALVGAAENLVKTGVDIMAPGGKK